MSSVVTGLWFFKPHSFESEFIGSGAPISTTACHAFAWHFRSRFLWLAEHIGSEDDSLPPPRQELDRLHSLWKRARKDAKRKQEELEPRGRQLLALGTATPGLLFEEVRNPAAGVGAVASRGVGHFDPPPKGTAMMCTFSHFYIFKFSHFYIFTFSHFFIFTFSHFHIFTF